MPHDQSLSLRLSAISAAIAEGLPWTAVCHRIVESVQQIGFDRVRLDLASPEGGSLETVATRGFTDGDYGEAPADGDAELVRLRQDCRPEVISRGHNGRADEYGWVPILLGNRIVGQLWVDNASSRQPLDRERLQDALHFAHQAALLQALQRGGSPLPPEPDAAREREELRRTLAEQAGKLARLERLAQASRRMMENLDAMVPRQRLALIAESAADILEAETAGVFLVWEGELVLEASYGHRGAFEPGQLRLAIRDEPGSGLTGAIACRGEVYRAHGGQLTSDPAFSGKVRSHTPSGECYSLLAIPLKKKGQDGSERLVGLLRADNKKRDGKALQEVEFTKDDVSVLFIFAKAAVEAIVNAEMWENRRRLIESSPNGIIAVQNGGKVIEFNREAGEILGYTRDEALGLTSFDLYFDRKEPYKIRDGLLKSPDGQLRDFRTTLKSSTGEAIPVRHSSTLLKDAEGRRIGSVGYFEDLRRESLLLRASDILAKADTLDNGLQELVELIVSHLGRSFCGILLCDEGSETLTLRAEILSGNPTWRSRRQKIEPSQWEGLSEHLQKGRPWERLWSDDRARPFLEKLSQLFGFDKAIESLLVAPLKSGDRIVGQMDLGNLAGEGRSPFTEEEQELIFALAAQITILISRFQLLEWTSRRKRLLEALVEASTNIRADVALPSLQQVIVRLAAQLGRCRMGGLFLNRPYLGQLELVRIHNGPQEHQGLVVSHEQGLIGRMAREGGKPAIVGDLDTEPFFRTLGLHAVVLVPLQAGSGEVDAILFLGEPDGEDPFNRTDLDVLEAFATQATITLSTARLMAREKLYFSQIETLSRISLYIQGKEDLQHIVHPVLTGVTASYGLGFNRAVMLLVDETAELLVGEMGIGQLEEAEANAAWEADIAEGLNNLITYLQRLENGKLSATPVGEKARGLKLPARGDDVFSEVVQKRRLQKVRAEELSRVPQRFRDTFEVTTEMAVAPLVTKGEVIGILAVDNKFTQSPIGHELCDALMTFASAAAAAISTTRLLEQTRSDARKLRAYYEMSGELVALREPNAILEKVVLQTRDAASASWVTLLLIDNQGRARNPVPSTQHPSANPQQRVSIRPEGISRKVMATGQAEIIENVQKRAGDVNPKLIERGYQAAICLPMSVRGQPIGVMWLHYDQPRRFPDSELEALQLYANQAAIAFDSARLLGQVQGSQRAAQAVARITLLEEQGKTFDSIAEEIARALGCGPLVIFRYDEDRRKLFHPPAMVRVRHPELAARQGYRTGDSLVLALLEGDQEEWIVEDVSQDRRFKDRRFTREEGVRSCMAIQLRAAGRKVGALFVNYPDRRQFTADELTSIRLFAGQAAVAIRNAQLFAERTIRLAQQQELSEILLAAQTVQETLDRAVRFAAGALKADFCNVVLPSDDQDRRLVFSAGYGWGQYLVGKLVLQPDRGSHTGYTIQQERPVPVYDYRLEKNFKVPRIVHRHHIRSGLSVPMFRGDDIIGAMLVHCRHPRKFTAEEIVLLGLIANQTALALERARQYEASFRKSTYLEALAQASRAITTNLRVERRQRWELIDDIVRPSMDTLMKRLGPKALGSLDMCDEAEEFLTLKSIYTVDPHPQLSQYKEDARPLAEIRARRGRISVVGRAWLSKRSQNVKDVTHDPDYVALSASTRSELAVPIFNQGKVIGVLNAESDRIAAFDEEDQRALEALAELASLAIQSAHRVEELRTRTALAWMGMGNVVSSHELGGAVGRVQNEIHSLKESLDQLSQEAIERGLSRIARQLVQDFPTTRAPKGRADEDLALIPVNDVIRSRRIRNRPGGRFRLGILQGVEDTVRVRANVHWLQGVLDIVINNARDVTRGQRDRTIVLGSRYSRRWQDQEWVEIFVSDNGPGIPKKLQAIILHEPIPKAKGEKGTGTGLLIALQIVGIYGGRMYWEPRPGGGTTMVVALPVSEEETGGETAPV